MVRIRCINPNCTNAPKGFQWDESLYVDSGGGIAQPHEPGAVRIAVTCPHCLAEMAVWVRGAKTRDSIVRDLK
jgi:hypothetical protein